MLNKRILPLLLVLLLAGFGCQFEPLDTTDTTNDEPRTSNRGETTDEETMAPDRNETDTSEEEPADEETGSTDETPSDSEETPADEGEKEPTPAEPAPANGYGGKVIGDVSVKTDDAGVVVFLTAEKADYKGKDAYMEFGCGSVLVPVKRNLTKTQSDLAHAIVELITIKQNAYESQGLRNAVAPSASTIKLTNIKYEGSKRIIEFEGQFKSTGVCEDPRIKAQIEETIKLYAPSYEIRLNGSAKEWRCLFDASGSCS